MARYTESVCRLCRREGMKLFLKGDRCFKDKCAIERRNYPPGQHGRRRSQAAGLRHPAAREAEGQADLRPPRAPVPPYLRSAPSAARASPARTCSRSSSGASTTSSTPRASRPRARRRASSCATATSRSTAGRSRSRPSAVGKGQVVAIKEKSRANEQIKASVETARARGVPAWLDLTPETFSRNGRGAAEARGHQAADPGAADRRALLEVTSRPARTEEEEP